MRKLIRLAVVISALVMMLSTANADPTRTAPGIVTENIGWQLTNSRVMNPGKTATLPEGTLISGYQVEADAKGIGRSPVAKGTFQMTASFFSPSQDMPGQQAGQWYVQGSWKITDTRLTTEQRKTRHNSGTIQGLFSAQLPFNPSAAGGMVDALVSIPMSPAGGFWTDAEGTFSGTEKFEGTIMMSSDKWPDVRKGYGR